MSEQDGARGVEQIGTVVVDPDDLIAAFERNRDDESERRRHGLRVSSPFEGETRAELHAIDGETSALPAADATSVCLPPERFVENYRGDDPDRTTVRIPTRQGSRNAARRDHGEAVDDETVAEYHETAMDVWTDCIHDSLLDAVRVDPVPDAGDAVRVDVRYESDRPD
ncbi:MULTISPECIES: hypothetical protein [Halostella]|uniref:hypothetical protein n=1 Tax=Halostella TaxID=1843185 RepID=UPI001080C764|nr:MULTISPECIES: hypothetical protein [Halostella]